MADVGTWKRCSACKRPIAYGQDYWACNVSTCNRKRTALAFCTVSCWEVHLPGANHREAWAVERVAPSEAEAAAESPSAPAPARAASAPAPDAGGERPRRRIVARPAAAKADDAPKQVLVVASRLKDYVRARAGYNTSDRVLEPLSDHVRRIVDEAIENARRDGRQTVLDRDVPDL